ncbi:dinitrogenase 3 delta subunit [Rhodovulum sp. PH10]|uniref:Fe-only nitrogenase subunit delta n=1 Tax=Rhodovulum sp. PH10 TaxID=1187851 RepID=UPI00027C222A|nr:Fe-only nitrogenase subunit delta [Rhodovulum sp. PH10]EJW10894.1 dinitrogenase 3 delta subunit [Rhodovulum sp. PH10]
MTKITHSVVSDHPFPNDAAAADAALAAWEALDDVTRDRVDVMVDWIMKYCLWQFHSRAWDRTRQNAGILSITATLLCDEPYTPQTPDEKVYWVDAVTLARNYRKICPWLADMSKDEIKSLVTALHARIEYLTVTGSLNEELTDQHY